MPNARRTFWVVSGGDGERREVQARLRTLTSHTAMWVEEGSWHDVSELERAAEHFETEIYTTTRSVFGSEWRPGIDHDRHIHILHVGGLGETLLGYTSTLDEYPTTANSLSNEAEMITVNMDAVEIGSPTYHALLGRELVRLIQWHQDRNEERWVREGLVELGSAMAGWDTELLEEAYLREMDTPLTAWEATDGQRGGAYLLMRYLRERFGDEGIRALTAQLTNGTAGFSAALESLDPGVTFESFFGDWLTSSYLDSVALTQPVNDKYGESNLLNPSASGVYTTYPVTVTASVNQLGADIILLRGEEDLHVSFQGVEETDLLAGTQGFRQAWWSNRADESFTVLTRTLELRDAAAATLSYRIWYDMEKDFDYGTLEVSADGGASWQILQTPSGTKADAYGNNPGWGYTGSSGGWIEEAVDLSAYTGGTIQVRFGYLTDGAVTGDGFLLNSIVLERDGAERLKLDGSPGWRTGGFVLTDGIVAQDYLGLLVTAGEETEVERLSFEPDRSAVWTIPLGREDLNEAAIILSAAAPFTRLPAAYSLTITEEESAPSTGVESTGD